MHKLISYAVSGKRRLVFGRRVSTQRMRILSSCEVALVRIRISHSASPEWGMLGDLGGAG